MKTFKSEKELKKSMVEIINNICTNHNLEIYDIESVTEEKGLFYNTLSYNIRLITEYNSIRISVEIQYSNTESDDISILNINTYIDNNSIAMIEIDDWVCKLCYCFNHSNFNRSVSYFLQMDGANNEK